MVTATIYTPVDLSKSFYAKVGDDFRLYIPREFRETVVKIQPGDVVWLIVGTIVPRSSQGRIIIP